MTCYEDMFCPWLTAAAAATAQSGTVVVRPKEIDADPRCGQPAIKLANEGLEPDGWHDLGGIAVQ